MLVLLAYSTSFNFPENGNKLEDSLDFNNLSHYSQDEKYAILLEKNHEVARILTDDGIFCIRTCNILEL